MAKPELGIKRTCPVTGRKFYDLDKDPIVSPYTGQSYVRSFFDPIVTRGGSRAAPVPVQEEEEEEVADPAAAAADAEFVPIEEADATEGKEAVVEDIDIEETIGEDDADTFLEEEEEGDDDVADLIDGDLEPDEET